jgi:hypothetical protein
VGVVAGGTGRRVGASRGSPAMEHSRWAVVKVCLVARCPVSLARIFPHRISWVGTLMTARWDSR